MQITAKQIRELADQRLAEADNSKDAQLSDWLRVCDLRKTAYQLASNLDDLKELLGVSHLSVEINDRP